MQLFEPRRSSFFEIRAAAPTVFTRSKRDGADFTSDRLTIEAAGSDGVDFSCDDPSLRPAKTTWGPRGEAVLRVTKIGAGIKIALGRRFRTRGPGRRQQ